MKSNKSTFYAILLWGLVIYAIALLTYFSLRGYVADNKDFISNFGTLLGGIGTFFAAFIAAYLFTDWKVLASHETKKEHLSKLITLTTKLRYNLIVKRQALTNILKVNESAVINDEIKSLDASHDSEIDESFFEIRFSILYLTDDITKDILNPLDYYGKMHHHFTHISQPFWIVKHNYDKYYDYLIKKIDPNQLNYNHNIINRSYNYFDISFPFKEQIDILMWKNLTIGYDIFDDKTQIWHEIRYENIIKMIDELIKMIDEIEEVSIKALKLGKG